jgi:protein O-mannosyl-transferase
MRNRIYISLTMLCIVFLSCKEERITTIKELIQEESPSENDYINQSLAYYQEGKFLQSIQACEKAIETNPNNKMAWNNMCCAYIALENWDQAIKAGEKALEIDPSFELAKNNLDDARRNKSDESKLEMPKDLSIDEYINKSLNYYEQGHYLASIKACQKILEIDENHAIAYNNICAAYNALAQYEKALPYCRKAVALDPESEYAINNLGHTLENLIPLE